MIGRAHRDALGPVLLYAALTAMLAAPLSLRPGTTLLADDPDTHLYVWTVGWLAHALAAQPARIFDANIFHPEPLTLAYSENLLGLAPIAAPVLWATGNPVLALNLSLLATPVLCGLGAFLLARRLGLSRTAALLCGLIFAFSPARFFRLSQPHVTAVQWVPLMLAYLHAYLDTGRARHARAAVACFAAQALTSGHGAAFALVAGATLLAYRLALGEPPALARRLRDVGLPGVLLLAPALLVAVPYWSIQDRLGLRRSLVDWAPSPESFVASPAHVHQWLLRVLDLTAISETASAFLFPGLLPLVLAGAALVAPRRSGPRGPRRPWMFVALLLEAGILLSVACALYAALVGPIRWRAGALVVLSVRDTAHALLVTALLAAARLLLRPVAPLAPAIRIRWAVERWRAWARAHRRSPAAAYAVLTGVALLLAAGPPFGLWPLVYWLPGLSFIRVPSRFMVVAVLGLAVLAGLGLDRLRAACPAAWRRRLAGGILALVVVESTAAPLATVPFRLEPLPAERWLARQPGPFAVAEVPVFPFARSQSTYMLHAMWHWQKTVHGYSGAVPARHAALYEALRGFPDADSLDQLADLGVDYIVVHRRWYGIGEWAAVEARLEAFGERLERVFEEDGEGGDRVYALRSPTRRGF